MARTNTIQAEVPDVDLTIPTKFQGSDPLLDVIFDEYLREYQRAFLNDCSRFRLVLKSRQVGFSDAVALDSVLAAAGVHPNKWPASVYVVSRTERDAKDVIAKAANWVRLLAASPSIGVNFDGVDIGLSELKFPSGFVMQAQSQSQEACRGKTGHIILDEFEHYHWQNEIWTAAFPAASAAGDRYTMTLIFTANGTSKLGYDFWNDRETNSMFSRHYIDVHHAVKFGFPLDVEVTKSAVGLERFQQEYECKFHGAAGRLWSKNDIDAATRFVTADELSGMQRFLGIDIASEVDTTALVLVHYDPKNRTFYLGDSYQIKGVPYASNLDKREPGQDFLIEALIKALRPYFSVMDVTNEGRTRAQGKNVLSDLLRHRQVAIRPLQVNYTNKKEAVEGLMLNLSRGATYFVKNRRDFEYTPRRTWEYMDNTGGVIGSLDEFLRNCFVQGRRQLLVDDFQKIKKVWSNASNKLIYVADRDKTGHADAFWACSYGHLQAVRTDKYIASIDEEAEKIRRNPIAGQKRHTRSW